MPVPVAMTELYHRHMSVLEYSTVNMEQMNEVLSPFLEHCMVDVCVLRWCSNAVKMRTFGILRQSPEHYRMRRCDADTAEPPAILHFFFKRTPDKIRLCLVLIRSKCANAAK
jgi:hypothetical protein